MGRKKKGDSGKHKTPRRMVGLPLPWFQVAQRLARQKPAPTTWYLCELIQAAAVAAGMTDLPPPPWETEDK